VKVPRLWQSFHGHSQFGANAALTAATNLVLGALGIVSGVIVARLLGPHGRGELAAIQIYPTLIGYLSMLGTDQALVYFSAREPDRAGHYVASAAVISLASLLPFVLVAYMAMPLLLSTQSSQIVAAARGYLLIVPLIVILSLALYALRGGGQFAPWNALRVMAALAWMSVLVIAWGLGSRDPRWVARANLEALALLLIPIALVVRGRVPGKFVPDAQQFRPMLSYGLPCIASSFPMVLNLRLDQMLMAALLAPSMLGLYVAAVAWSGAINPLMNAIGTVLFPRVAGHGESADRLRSFARGSRLAALLALVTTPVLFMLTPWGLIMLFGRKFQSAIPSGLMLVPAGAIAALNTVIEEGLRGLGKPVAILHAELAGLVTTVVCLYLLLRPMGIMGASIASLLGYSTVMAFLLVHACWLTGESPITLLLPNSTEVQSGIKQLVVLARRMVPAISRRALYEDDLPRL
jgi:O-antigen/teichoic acid export membrane protein